MFYAQERLGKTRYRTPEGFLLCVDVPISRVGTFDYKKSEAGIDGGDVVKVTRSPEELFKPEAIGSFEGKPITIGHADFANPNNYQKVSRGVVQNVRRGEGEKADLLLADLMICDAEAIDKVESGKLTELSIGYEASVIADGFGVGHHADFVGNHVALVESARCGSVCKFGDGKMSIFSTILDALKDARALLEGGDKEKLAEAFDKIEAQANEGVKAEEAKPEGDEADKEPPKGEIGDEEPKKEAGDEADLAERVNALEAKINELLAKLEEPKPEGDEEPTDEVVVIVPEDEAEKVFDEAEELAGEAVKRPQGDSKDGKGFTVDTMRRVKLNALKSAKAISDKIGDVRKLQGDSIDFAFETALKLKRTAKNPQPVGRYFDSAVKLDKVAMINKRNLEFWKK